MFTKLTHRLWEAREGLDRFARQSPARLALGVFAGVIVLFTMLLSLPIATASGQRAPFVDSLFTATSAVCVTGLVTVPTGVFWSSFGHVVILIAIKIGGLGVMTLASILGMVVSRRIGLTQKLLTASETKTTRLGEVGSLIKVVIITSTTLELLVALLLIPRLLVLHESVGTALWHSLFYAISAFNNAGFVPSEAGLLPYSSDWLVLVPILLGVFIGSLGFPVILNLARRRFSFRRWTLHAQLTVVTSLVLLVAGSLLLLLLEWGNRATIGSLSWSEKLLHALMFGVMPRSGGFSTVEVSDMNDSSLLVTDALMFVGGGSASTAGGIKVTTLAVLMIAIVAEARGDRDMDVFKRRVPLDTLRLAIAVLMIGALIVFVSTLTLLQLTGFSLTQVLFESISAFATVGLSAGITSEFPDSGKYVLIVLMFIGRVGTMTLAAALALRERRRMFRFPEERPIIG